MELQLREQEIFNALRRIKNLRFVVIGGYAVNAYTLPRFSVDCDIVVENVHDVRVLDKLGYDKTENTKKFIRYEKEIYKDFRASIDVMIGEIIDRQTSAVFTASWIFENSQFRILHGKTITEQIRVRIINPDALFVMKFISCRNTDIRDVFMLVSEISDYSWIKEEISKRTNFNTRFAKIKEKITSVKFRDDLQGVYGYIDESLFRKQTDMFLRL